jgi:serine/threonine-protein kinase
MDGGASEPRTAEVDAQSAHGGTAKLALPDRWRLLELLGSGGQATVWLAEDRTLGQRVALKVLHTDANERTRGRWLEEVRQGRRLSHPNLIRIFDLVETSDRPVAVMEYVPGGTLSDRVRDTGPQPVNDVIDWTRDVLEVLSYLHQQRIVHRDVKPSNLLLTEDGRIKLSDLGLVRSLDRGSDLTRTMEGIGTPRFMAPEQLRGEQPTPACDLYSLGVTLYQLLTGRLPFDGDSAYQIADGHLHDEPIPVRDHRPDCPRWLAAFVARLLEKDPRARYPSARATLMALESRRIGLTKRTLRRLAAGVVVIAAATVAVAWWQSSINPVPERIEIVDHTVVARDSNSRVVWSQKRDGRVPNLVVADLLGGPNDEVAVAWAPLGKDSTPFAEIVIDLFDPNGELLRSSDLSRIAEFAFPDQTEVWSLRLLDVGNFVGRGSELVWTVVNPRSYPSMVGVTGYRGSKEERLLTVANSGHFQNLTVADLDGDGRDEIIATAFNNPLGFQRTLITAGAVSRVTDEPCGRLYSPEINAFRMARSDQPTGCFSFTPLGSNVLIVDSPKVTDAGIELVIDGEPRRFDVWANPETSPLFGSGGKAREAFWNDLAARCARMRVAPTVEPAFAVDALRIDHPEMMSEWPVEVAATLLAARALASGGHRDNAIAVLRNGVDRFPDERDLQLRLGEQLLIAGVRTEGRRRIRESITIDSTGRAYTDLSHMLILDAAVNGDADAYDDTRRFLDNLSVSPEYETLGFLDMSWLFFQGEWTDPRLLEGDVGWVHLWVRFVRAWARFETDGDAGAAMAVADELSAYVETRSLADLLEARVRIAELDVVTASQLADGALRDLETKCRMSFEKCVWIPLAEWTIGAALSDAPGREVEGRAMLGQAAEHAPNTWLARGTRP